MKFENSLWWPSDETALVPYGLNYQREIRDFAINLCNGQKQLCLDVGAHVGIAAIHFSSVFDTCLAFEPIPETFKCLTKNVSEHFASNVIPINMALSYGVHPIDFTYNLGNTGYTVPSESLLANNHFTVVPLDSFYTNPSLIKMDVEGFEANVILGAKETIQRSYPVFILEAKGIGAAAHNPTKPIELLKDMGYSVVHRISNDYVMKKGV